jgi:signal transduction histidine kinase
LSNPATSAGSRGSHPGPALIGAALFGVLALWLAFRGEASAVLVSAAALALIWYALQSHRAATRIHEASLEAALTAAAARNLDLARLQRVTASLLTGDTIERLFQEVAEAAGILLESAGGTVTQVVEEGRFVKVMAASSSRRRTVGTLLPVDSSLHGWVVTHEEPLICNDTAADSRNFPIPGVGPCAVAIVPLRSSGLVIGTLGVYDRQDGKPFEAAHLQLLQTLGDQVVVGLDRVHALEASRRNEAALADKNRELQRATELKSQFLANMSHELRTPLNAINGFSDLLLTGELGPLNEAQREFLDSVLRNGQHLLGLINSVLDLSKIEAGGMTLSLAPTDLRECILGAVADTASLRAARRQQCRTRIDESPIPLVADGTRIRQILFNLLSNSSKFTPEGGEVSVTAVSTRAPLPFPGGRSGERSRLVSREAVWISVSDTGIGILPGDMPRLFREFSQVDSSTSRQAQGTGLGLALSKKFVELHGGTIGAESVHGKGSSFWFLLPVDGPVRKRGESRESRIES